MFGDVTAGATTTTMLEVLAAERADLLVTEPLHLGAAVAGDLLAYRPWTSPSAWRRSWPSTLHPVTIGYQRGRWLERGLTPPDSKLLGRPSSIPARPRSDCRTTTSPPPDPVGRLAGCGGRAAGG